MAASTWHGGRRRGKEVPVVDDDNVGDMAPHCRCEWGGRPVLVSTLRSSSSCGGELVVVVVVVDAL